MGLNNQITCDDKTGKLSVNTILNHGMTNLILLSFLCDLMTLPVAWQFRLPGRFLAKNSSCGPSMICGDSYLLLEE
jgi:hypothetical protein